MTEASVPIIPSASADFPIRWDDPGDAHLFWTWDRMHFPTPVGWLTESVSLTATSHGFAAASERYSLPVRLQYRVFNRYAYNAMIPRSHDSAVLDEFARKAEGAIKAAMMDLPRAWNEDYLPELKADIDAFRSFDYGAAADGEVAAHAKWAIERTRRHWGIHFCLVVPMMMSSVIFADTFGQITGSDDDIAPFTLLQGLPNKTVDGAHALWNLSRVARASAPVRKALGLEGPGAFFADLDTSAEGREFAQKFRDYLDEYGWRGDLWTLDYPTWFEDPRSPLNTLRSYVGQPDEASPILEHARLAEKREEALAAVRARLASAPPEARGQFEGLLQLAQFASVLSEDHNYYIDQMLLHLTRRALIRAGERLARRGQIGDAADVLMLTGSEVVDALLSEKRPDLKQVVVERRAEFERSQSLIPPPAIGTPTPQPPPGVEPSPMEKGLTMFFGGPPKGSSVNEIRGNAGSRGTVTGVARVAMSLEDARALQPGEILVCPTTAPPWTPLFAVAGAVVTDTGGVLSHCAVVAREFGIPAVVGTHVATAMVKTGQRITVDGGAGIVVLNSA